MTASRSHFFDQVSDLPINRLAISSFPLANTVSFFVRPFIPSALRDQDAWFVSERRLRMQSCPGDPNQFVGQCNDGHIAM